MAKRLPSSLASYLKGIRKVLPEGCVSHDLTQLKVFRFEEAYPKKGEFLSSWVGTARRNAGGKLPLTMILGESSSKYRKQREGKVHLKPRLKMAYTCDGAGGANALFGLLRNSNISLNDLDFKAVIDEWSLRNPKIHQRVKNSHLLILGTAEVNIFAAFLHGLVKDFHYGQERWPPDLSSTGDKLFVGNDVYLRSPRDQEINDCGGVFLLRNPWNPDYRVLWIGGLSGRGTWHGCSMVASDWGEYSNMASISIGVVYGRDVLLDGEGVVPRDWLLWREEEPTWQSKLKPRPAKPPKKPVSKKHVFLSYCHDNAEQVANLREDLIAAGVTVWWDKDIYGGEDLKYALREAMDDSYAVAICLSNELISRKKSGVYPEISDAIEIFREFPPGSIFLIPVRLSDCKIPPIDIGGGRTLKQLKYVNLFPETSWGTGMKQLVEALQVAHEHC